jgi:hypothetical protein
MTPINNATLNTTAHKFIETEVGVCQVERYYSIIYR